LAAVAPAAARRAAAFLRAAMAFRRAGKRVFCACLRADDLAARFLGLRARAVASGLGRRDAETVRRTGGIGTRADREAALSGESEGSTAARISGDAYSGSAASPRAMITGLPAAGSPSVTEVDAGVAASATLAGISHAAMTGTADPIGADRSLGATGAGGIGAGRHIAATGIEATSRGSIGKGAAEASVWVGEISNAICWGRCKAASFARPFARLCSSTTAQRGCAWPSALSPNAGVGGAGVFHGEIGGKGGSRGGRCGADADRQDAPELFAPPQRSAPLELAGVRARRQCQRHRPCSIRGNRKGRGSRHARRDQRDRRHDQNDRRDNRRNCSAPIWQHAGIRLFASPRRPIATRLLACESLQLQSIIQFPTLRNPGRIRLER
jgi:hypothetical protein